jgi:hypothetical protein
LNNPFKTNEKAFWRGVIGVVSLGVSIGLGGYLSWQGITGLALR